MLNVVLLLPYSFWIALTILLGGIFYNLGQLRQGIGLPIIAVLGTIGAWYVGDVFYNDYVFNIQSTFSPFTLAIAWWEVALFLVAFLVMAPQMHRYFNRSHLRQSSYVFRLYQFGVGRGDFQENMRKLFYCSLAVWVVLTIIAAIRLGPYTLYYFFPYLGDRADPWGRGRIGGGFDSLLSVCQYVMLFTGMAFGVVAAVSTDLTAAIGAFLLCFLTWPYFLFDRTRNTILVLVVPAVAMFALFRLRVPVVLRVLAFVPFFFAVDIWFSFIISHRSDTTILQALNEQGISLKETQEVHHEGLNMYEELCWINSFIESGAFHPNLGYRYYSELVNPIPRSIWPDKPFIGLDYAVLRGQGDASNTESDVNATVSTGMIGQGVTNFGRILGPIAAALIMSGWVTLLAYMDLTGHRFGRVLLFGLGLILTFNLGRDITFITLYTFLFGWLLIWIAEKLFGGAKSDPGPASAAVPVPRKRVPRRPRPTLTPLPQAAPGETTPEQGA
jgi:hypothetical protein